MTDREDRMARKRGEPVACPFCAEPLPRPASLGEPGGALLEQSGGRCGCGAHYLLDATGRNGGQVLLDGLTLLCDGSLEQAMALQHGVDYQLQSRIYDVRGHLLQPGPARRSAYGLAKLWFFRRLAGCPPAQTEPLARSGDDQLGP